MKALDAVGTQTFSWRPAKGAKKTIEVYAGVDICGTLRQERGCPTVAVTTEGRWTIEKSKGAMTVRSDEGTVVAAYRAGKGDEGTVTLANGQVLRWGPTGKKTAERAFYEASGRRIVRFWKDWRLFKVEDRGQADAGMAVLAAFPVLVVLGRVIGITMEDGDAATIAALAVTSIAAT